MARNPMAGSLRHYRQRIVDDQREKLQRARALRQLQRLGQEFDAEQDIGG